MVVVYSFSHVGIVTGVYPTYVTVMESNTSIRGTVRNYTKSGGGIYEKIRKYGYIAYVTDCAECAIPFDNSKVLKMKQLYGF